MSLLFYLSLLNVGLGLSIALWIGFRTRYVHRQIHVGYDLQSLSPPSPMRQLLRRLGRKVDVSLVCQRLGTAPVPDSSETQLDETVDHFGEHAGSPSDIAPLDIDEASDPMVDSRELALNENDESAQSRELGPDTAIKTLSEKSHAIREVRCLEPLAAKYGATDSYAASAAGSKASKTLDSTSTWKMSNAKELKSQKLSADFRSPTQVDLPVPKSFATSSDTSQQRSEPRKSIDGDFLQRAAWIDQSLRTVLDQHDHPNELALREAASQVAATHQWWTEFEGSISKVLEKNAKQTASRDQRAQVDDDLIAMQASLVECQVLIGEAGLSVEPSATKNNSTPNAIRELPLKMRSRMMQATKACHRLRDNLVLMLPESPLQFSETELTSGDAESDEHLMNTRPTSFVSDYGVRGLTEIVRQWGQEVHAGTARLAALILIDIDKTGYWNDELGLESVDSVLKVCHEQIAECIRSNRGFDRVVRVSGQQFVIFLGATTTQAARFAAERIRQGFANTTWQATNQAFVLNISAAICDYQEATAIQAHITRLRQGLPEAKRVGGNAVVTEISPGRFKQVTGITKYSLPARHHDQLSEKWKPKAEMTCAGS